MISVFAEDLTKTSDNVKKIGTADLGLLKLTVVTCTTCTTALGNYANR